MEGPKFFKLKPLLQLSLRFSDLLRSEGTIGARHLFRKIADHHTFNK